VRFGEPDLVHHALFDAVVKYETTTDTFASRVYCSAHPEGPRCAPHAGHAEPAAPAERTRCRTREQLREHPILKGNLDPLNFLHAMRGVPTYELTSLAAIEAARARHPGRFPVVFVGADHDSSDLFNTPVGERSGVALHAYAVYSMAHALPARHGWALVIDIVLGTVVGVGLHWSRGGRRAGQGPWERLWRAGLGVAIVGLAGALVLLGARGLMLWNMWINPGPLLGAIFVKTWLAHADTHHDTHHATAAAPSVGDRLVGVFYCALLVAVLVETARIISHSH
jgi:hypothetical protein